MQTEIKLTKTELRKISREFRTIASRLLRTEYKQGMSNLKRFVAFIEENKIINEFIQEHNKYNFHEEIYDSNGFAVIPDDSKSHEISYVYQLLKAHLEECKNNGKDIGYVNLAMHFGRSKKFQETVDNFGKNVISPFVSHVEGYLTDLQIDMGDEDQTKISIQVHGDNYGGNLGNTMSETNIDQSNSSIGIGVSQNSEIKTEKIAGTINEASQKNIAEVAAEIQELLEQLSQSYPTSTSKEKTILVAEAVDRIEHNPTFKAKVINALKAGGTEAFKEAIDRPFVNILLATFEGWKETE
ncbi:hypothetical protein H1P_4050006 [Hyella patelloides LEGE 07179]|uniref:Uncharacterized protein n=1 Tax=Hyella patelloides LEGE 07179 TaxID=945734 RepID=A0A563VXI2_9CYAN|nr:hypothetical protein [Hyella patelloides]VEP16115.1 hypothetical protein H1P_4050006 [Hyella patelloides LEGE 07179]